MNHLILGSTRPLALQMSVRQPPGEAIDAKAPLQVEVDQWSRHIQHERRVREQRDDVDLVSGRVALKSSCRGRIVGIAR